MKLFIWLILVSALVSAAPAAAQSVDTPMHFVKKFSGQDRLRFAVGRVVNPQGKTRLNYRVISSTAEWKKLWGYLYDDLVKVDFSKKQVLIIYKSPAKGGYDLTPKRVSAFQGDLNIELDVVWNGKTTPSHPYLFLVLDKFKKLSVDEKFISPTRKEIHYP